MRPYPYDPQNRWGQNPDPAAIERRWLVRLAAEFVVACNEIPAGEPLRDALLDRAAFWLLYVETPKHVGGRPRRGANEATRMQLSAVIDLHTQGLDRNAIARRLRITPRTVQRYLNLLVGLTE